jgi:hypothetical protein
MSLTLNKKTHCFNLNSKKTKTISVRRDRQPGMDIYVSCTTYKLPQTNYIPSFEFKKVLFSEKSSVTNVQHNNTPMEYDCFTGNIKDSQNILVNLNKKTFKDDTDVTINYFILYTEESGTYLREIGIDRLEDFHTQASEITEADFDPSRISALAPGFRHPQLGLINLSGVFDLNEPFLAIFKTLPVSWDQTKANANFTMLPTTQEFLNKNESLKNSFTTLDMLRNGSAREVRGEYLVADERIIRLSGKSVSLFWSTWQISTIIADLTEDNVALVQFKKKSGLLINYDPRVGITGLELLQFTAKYTSMSEDDVSLPSPILLTLKRTDNGYDVVLVTHSPLTRASDIQSQIQHHELNRQNKAQALVYVRVAATATALLSLSRAWYAQKSHQRLRVLRAALLSRCGMTNPHMSSSLVQNALIMTGFRLPATAVFHAATGKRRQSKKMLCRAAMRLLRTDIEHSFSLSDVVLAISLAATLIRPTVVGLVVSWLASVMRGSDENDHSLGKVQEALNNVALTPESVAEIDPRLLKLIKESTNVSMLRKKAIKYFASIRLLRTLPLFVVVFTDGTERPLDELRRAIKAFAVTRSCLLQKASR